MIRSILFNKRGQFRVIIVALFSLTLAAFGFIPLMGLPGALMMAVGDFILQWTVGFFGYSGIFTFPRSDAWAWPVAIYATLVWPIGFFLAYVIAFRLISASRRTSFIVWTFVLLVWVTLMTLWLYFMVKDFVGGI
ncbi:MAG: hypothetical protein ABL890_04055 [Candidatus Peribacteraceae bacterium]